MARKKYGKQIGKIVAALVLVLVAVIGLSYGSLLRGMLMLRCSSMPGSNSGCDLLGPSASYPPKTAGI